MSCKRLGRQTALLMRPPVVLGWASTAGRRESEGPLGTDFDQVVRDDSLGEASWEKAESELQRRALALALQKTGITAGDLDCILAGDLLNQCIASSFALRGLDVPVLGLYGACSTMAEALGLAALCVDSGFAHRAAALTSSHFCSAERQYRTPLEYGGQRPPTAQWTVTGAGAVILSRSGEGPRLTHFTPGRIVDLGITDPANMGAAMAPAAADVILRHLSDTGREADFYDLILTGDLGSLGRDLLRELLARDGVLPTALEDCGARIYDPERQDVHCGGSGCGCSAAVLAGPVLRDLKKGRWKHILFCGTGALLSPTSTLQGESIPGICHAVALSGADTLPEQEADHD